MRCLSDLYSNRNRWDYISPWSKIHVHPECKSIPLLLLVIKNILDQVLLNMNSPIVHSIRSIYTSLLLLWCTEVVAFIGYNLWFSTEGMTYPSNSWWNRSIISVFIVWARRLNDFWCPCSLKYRHMIVEVRIETYPILTIKCFLAFPDLPVLPTRKRLLFYSTEKRNWSYEGSNEEIERAANWLVLHSLLRKLDTICNSLR